MFIFRTKNFNKNTKSFQNSKLFRICSPIFQLITSTDTSNAGTGICSFPLDVWNPMSQRGSLKQFQQNVKWKSMSPSHPALICILFNPFVFFMIFRPIFDCWCLFFELKISIKTQSHSKFEIISFMLSHIPAHYKYEYR